MHTSNIFQTTDIFVLRKFLIVTINILNVPQDEFHCFHFFYIFIIKIKYKDWMLFIPVEICVTNLSYRALLPPCTGEGGETCVLRFWEYQKITHNFFKNGVLIFPCMRLNNTLQKTRKHGRPYKRVRRFSFGIMRVIGININNLEL